MRLSTRIILLFGLVTAATAASTVFAALLALELGMSPVLAWILGVLVVTPVAAWAASSINRQITQLHDDLGNALRATRDGDYSLRLTRRGDVEIAELKALYNELADAVREDRQKIHGREILLDTLLQRSPQAVLLLDDADRVAYSNPMARQLFANGARVDGRHLDELVSNVEPVLRELLRDERDGLLRVGDETFHLTQRPFQMHTRRHRLILLERLTADLRRQELAVWKNAIRIINHEINNSVAPISSLFHSARLAQDRAEHRHRVGEIYGLIEERLEHLRHFLESYAEFARLPQPGKRHSTWAAVMEEVRALYPFRVEGDFHFESPFDPGQIQQVLINLVKNAHESGTDPSEVVVSVQRSQTDVVLQVLDRGRGMAEDVMRQALVPFYTTKPSGSGLGLALSNEIVEAHGGRVRLAAREGGGTIVTCWIPLH